jgi:septal ring factor EnvC (AmiA/AmiB activator)
LGFWVILREMQDNLKRETEMIFNKINEIQLDFDVKYDQYLNACNKKNINTEQTWELNAIKRKIEIEKKKIQQNEQQIKVLEKSIQNNEDNTFAEQKETIRPKKDDYYNKDVKKILKGEKSQNKDLKSGFVWSVKTEKILAEVLQETEYDFEKAIRVFGEKLEISPIWNEEDLRKKWTEIYLKKKNEVEGDKGKENVDDFDELD